MPAGPRNRLFRIYQPVQNGPGPTAADLLMGTVWAREEGLSGSPGEADATQEYRLIAEWHPELKWPRYLIDQADGRRLGIISAVSVTGERREMVVIAEHRVQA